MIAKLFKSKAKSDEESVREFGDWKAGERWKSETMWKCKFAPLCWHQDFGHTRMGWSGFCVCKNRTCLKPEAFGILSSWTFSLSKMWVAKERKGKVETKSEWMSDSQNMSWCTYFSRLFLGLDKNVNAYVDLRVHLSGRAAVNFVKSTRTESRHEWKMLVANRLLRTTHRINHWLHWKVHCMHL